MIGLSRATISLRWKMARIQDNDVDDDRAYQSDYEGPYPPQHNTRWRREPGEGSSSIPRELLDDLGHLLEQVLNNQYEDVGQTWVSQAQCDFHQLNPLPSVVVIRLWQPISGYLPWSRLFGPQKLCIMTWDWWRPQTCSEMRPFRGGKSRSVFTDSIWVLGRNFV